MGRSSSEKSKLSEAMCSQTSESNRVGRLVEHLFRYQSARLVARLTAIFGPANLGMAEEVVQEALVTAMQKWPFHGIPERPDAWLARVARNKALDRIRRRSNFSSKQTELQTMLEHLGSPAIPSTTLAGEVDEDQLRLMFMCCHPTLAKASQIALTLKTVGGLGRDELARAFLTRPATMAQRLVRAKKQAREAKLVLEMPAGSELAARLSAVHDVLYLIFNEGYGAHVGNELVRPDLCREAIRLTSILASHRKTASPGGKALLALMLFLAARLRARTDELGNVILLAQQDRRRWDGELIGRGFGWFEQSLDGEDQTRFHIEAAIAAAHARAPSYESTEWSPILQLYDSLAEQYPSPIVELNRAVALSFVKGPEEALARLEALAQNEGGRELESYYLYPGTLAKLHSELGNRQQASHFYKIALKMPCSEPERRLLRQRLAEVS